MLAPAPIVLICLGRCAPGALRFIPLADFFSVSLSFSFHSILYSPFLCRDWTNMQTGGVLTARQGFLTLLF